MTHSDRCGWVVYGADSDGKADGIATDSEAEAVEVFWRLADSWRVGHVAYYPDGRTLWLDGNTAAVKLIRIDLAALAAHLDAAPAAGL